MLVVSLLNCDLCGKGLKMSTGQSTLKNLWQGSDDEDGSRVVDDADCDDAIGGEGRDNYCNEKTEFI